METARLIEMPRVLKLEGIAGIRPRLETAQRYTQEKKPGGIFSDTKSILRVHGDRQLDDLRASQSSF